MHCFHWLSLYHRVMLPNFDFPRISISRKTTHILLIWCVRLHDADGRITESYQKTTTFILSFFSKFLQFLNYNSLAFKTTSVSVNHHFPTLASSRTKLELEFWENIQTNKQQEVMSIWCNANCEIVKRKYLPIFVHITLSTSNISETYCHSEHTHRTPQRL